MLSLPSKYSETEKRIIELFNDNNGRCGYRRINALLRKVNILISEKIVRKIIKENNLVVKTRKAKKCSSYKGEISLSPNALLVNNMLDEYHDSLAQDEMPLMHSVKGRHYRWGGWIERMEKCGFTRSMSKKGCSPDNSASSVHKT